MKNLFQKKPKTDDDDDLQTPQKNKYKNKKQQQQPRTPPITPSPPTSPLPIKIISKTDQSPLSAYASQQNDNIIQQKLYQQTLFDATSDSTPSPAKKDPHSILASILGCGIGADSTSYEFDDNFFLKNVPSMMWESHKDGLSPIPEEAITMWGVAPSESDSDDDEDKDDNGEDDDAFECVLQEQDNGSGEEDKHVELFCQPCIPTNGIVMAKQQMTKDLEGRQIMTTTVTSTDDQKQKQQQKKKTTKTTKTTKNSMVQKISSFTNRSNQTNKSNSTSTNNATTSTKEEPKKTFGKLFHSKGKSTVAQAPKKKQRNGKWKCAKDEKSGRIYYYHTLTRQVSWERPADFKEWKATLDKNTNKFYYYNAITRETTWVRPADFEVWKKVENKDKVVYYYNVLTKETRWEKPDDYNDKRTGVAQNVGGIKPVSTTVNAGLKSKGLDGVKNEDNVGKAQNVASRSVQSNLETVVTKASKEKNTDNSTKLAEKSSVSSNTYQQLGSKISPNESEESIVIASPREVFSEEGKTKDKTVSFDEQNEPGRIEPTPEHERLKRLLAKYCPDEEENNHLLISKAYGREGIIIKGLENLIGETPFDELRLAIFSYVKETLRGMGEQPFDENPNLQNMKMILRKQQVDSNVGSRQRSKTPDFSPPNSYSMDDKMLSSMTVKSNISNATVAVNNTTSARRNQSKPYSFTKGRSTMSNSTQQANNTSMVKESPITRSRSVQRDLLMDTENSEKKEEGLAMNGDKVSNKKIIADLKLMEPSEILFSGSQKKEKKSSQNEELQDLEKAKNISSENPNVELRNRRAESSNDRDEKPATDDSDDALSITNETVESAYAADYDDFSDDDNSLFDDQELDDISALSDPLPQPSRKKRNDKGRTRVVADCNFEENVKVRY